jgi:hypothetical protein
MTESFKNIVITGGAQKPTRQPSRKKKDQKGGGDSELKVTQPQPVPFIPKEPLQSQPAPASNPAGTIPLGAIQSNQTGGVTLKPKKPKVILQPHKQIKHSAKNATRKVRKVVIHTKQMFNGMTRAKRFHTDSISMSIDAIRQFLIEKGIIQPSSKAPASMLRSMYSDCNIIRDGKAL